MYGIGNITKCACLPFFSSVFTHFSESKILNKNNIINLKYGYGKLFKSCLKNLNDNYFQCGKIVLIKMNSIFVST